MKFFFVKKNAQKGAETLNASGAGTQEPDDRGRLGTLLSDFWPLETKQI